jgi:hypothetical protein
MEKTMGTLVGGIKIGTDDCVIKSSFSKWDYSFFYPLPIFI